MCPGPIVHSEPSLRELLEGERFDSESKNPALDDRALALYNAAQKKATEKAAAKHKAGEEAVAVGADLINTELLDIFEKQSGDINTLEDINSLLASLGNLLKWVPKAEGENLYKMAAFQGALTAHMYKLAEDNILPALKTDLKNIRENGLGQLEPQQQKKVNKMCEILNNNNKEYGIEEKLGGLRDIIFPPEPEAIQNPQEPPSEKPGLFKQLYLSIVDTLKKWFGLTNSRENQAKHGNSHHAPPTIERGGGPRMR